MVRPNAMRGESREKKERKIRHEIADSMGNVRLPNPTQKRRDWKLVVSSAETGPITLQKSVGQETGSRVAWEFGRAPPSSKLEIVNTSHMW